MVILFWYISIYVYICSKFNNPTKNTKIMNKEITICFADDHLRNEQAKIVANFGNVSFNPEGVVIERPGYNKEFLDYVLYCDDICGGFYNGKTFINIPENKIVNISIKEK